MLARFTKSSRGRDDEYPTDDQCVIGFGRRHYFHPNRELDSSNVGNLVCAVGSKHLYCMNLIGKSREQIAALTRNASRSELIDLLYSLATLEPMFTPAEIAARRKLSKRKVIELMKSGVITAHKPLANGWRAKLSAVQAWDEQTAVRAISIPPAPVTYRMALTAVETAREYQLHPSR